MRLAIWTPSYRLKHQQQPIPSIYAAGQPIDCRSWDRVGELQPYKAMPLLLYGFERGRTVVRLPVGMISFWRHR